MLLVLVHNTPQNTHPPTHPHKGSLGIGGALGVTVAKRMAITDLPQMVAAFHSLVGLAAVNTSIASYMLHPAGDPVHSVATLLGTFIGAVTLTGEGGRGGGGGGGRGGV